MSNPFSGFPLRISQLSRRDAKRSKGAGAALLAKRTRIDAQDTLNELRICVSTSSTQDIGEVQLTLAKGISVLGNTRTSGLACQNSPSL